MISYIQTLPVEYGLPLVVGAGVLLSTIGTFVANSIFTPEELIENNAVGGFKYAFLAQIVAALLAFSLVDSGTRFVSFQFKTDREVSTISLMQKLERFLPAEAGKLSAAEQNYIKKVIDYEWSSMREGKAAPEVTIALENWYVAAMSTKTVSEREKLALSQYMRLFHQVVEARTSRVSDSFSPFESLIWISMGAAVIVTISFNWFFGSYSLSTQLAMGALLTSGVMILVYVSIVLSSPVKSPIGVTPAEYIILL